MKKLKTFISVLLIFSLLPVFASYAQEEEYAEEIVISEMDEYKKLSAFGVFTKDDNPADYKKITRGLFMKFAMKCYFGEGVYPDTGDIQNIFNDVSSSTDGAREIAVANKLGIVNGNGSSFRPGDVITSSEAAKVLVSVLGYGEIAENRGGYPTGYLALANQLDIFDGCTFDENSTLTLADAVLALENTLEAEVLEISAIHGYNPGITTTYSKNNKTLLEYVFGIYREEGIVESNEYTSIYGLTDVEDDRVKIDDVRYIENGSGAADLLGYNTECYYRMDKPEQNRVIVYIAPYDNNVVTTESEYIEKSLVSATTFGYYKDADATKVTDVKIAKAATLIYNGGQMSLTPRALCPENGSVTLVDNNGDNTYDVVIVMNYRTILVSGVSASSYTVSDMLGGESIRLSYDKETSDDVTEYDVIIEVDGVKADFDAIGTRNVISYAESTGNKKNIKYALVSTKYVEGTPEAVFEDDNTITINGTDYPVTAGLIQSVTLKDSGIYYLDFNGKIVARKIEKDVVYGYLNNVIRSEGLSDAVMAQIFTENNRWVELELNEKITYNGKSQKAEVFLNDCTDKSAYRQLITYTVDEAGKINMIRFAQSFQEYSDSEENAIEQDIFRVYPEIATMKYRNGLKTFAETNGVARILLNENTKMFVVPDQSVSDAAKEDFTMLIMSDLVADETYSKITPYDYDRVRTAGAVVITGYKKSINSKSDFMVVDSMVRTLNSEDTAVKGIKGYYKDSLITLAAKDDTVFADTEYSEGDVIQFSLDENGNISNVILRYDYSAGDKQPVGSTVSYTTNSFVAGKVYYADANVKKFLTEGTVKNIIGTDGNTIINVYDTKTKTLVPGTIADLEKGNRFIARIVYYVADEIIVYH